MLVIGHATTRLPSKRKYQRMSGPQPQPVSLSPAQQALLESLLRQTSCPQAMALRVRIVLAAAAGQRNETLAHTLGCSLPTVRKWRQRWADAQAALAAAEAHTPDLRALVASVLADATGPDEAPPGVSNTSASNTKTSTSARKPRTLSSVVAPATARPNDLNGVTILIGSVRSRQ